MGLLDDAIREHLELKRRRGADPSEISRQESDALGPVRRAPDGMPDLADLPPLQESGPDAPVMSDAPAVVSDAPAPRDEETTVQAPPSEPIHEPPPVPAAPPPAAYEPTAAPPPPDEPPAAPDEPAAEEPSHQSLLARLRPGRREQPEAPLVPPPEHSPETHEPDIVPADDEPEGEDLLEETPEFLEETPEHDRLWFEQRPPRDFNFDD